jgi:hypothetical protein
MRPPPAVLTISVGSPLEVAPIAENVWMPAGTTSADPLAMGVPIAAVDDTSAGTTSAPPLTMAVPIPDVLKILAGIAVASPVAAANAIELGPPQ